MKLRYLHMKDYGPLKDVDVVFSASSPLNRTCSIRFVVGVNGSGKTHLLKALSAIFIALADWQPPHFPATLIFELGEESPVFTLDGSQLSSADSLGGSTVRTIILDSPGKKKDAGLWIYDSKLPDDTDFGAVLKELNNKSLKNRNFRPIIPRGEWTGKASTPNLGYLPKAVLAYTTGAPESWEKLWLPKADSEGADTLSQDLEYKWEDNERPLGWDIWQERSLNFGNGSPIQEAPIGREEGAWQPLLLDKQKLKCALLAVTLSHTIKNLVRVTQDDLKTAYLEELRAQGESMSGLDGLLARGGWAWPVSVSVKQDSKIGGDIARHERQNYQLKLDWLSHATQVIPEPYPGKLRTLWFDMGGNTKSIKSSEADAQDEDAYPSGAATLLKLLGGSGASAFERFEQLLDLLDRGVINDLNIMLRKIDHDDLLNFDDLSDGEQMVLCRMALFHLLEGQKDVLLLLDEPETHFNDKWKRDVVDIIDSAIGDAFMIKENAQDTATMSNSC
jgi:ABC-type transport system involved in cytochrome c biogenesis ATPase subunit